MNETVDTERGKQQQEHPASVIDASDGKAFDNAKPGDVVRFSGDASGLPSDGVEGTPQEKSSDALEVEFIHNYRNIARRAYENSHNKGFWDKKRNKSEMLMLMVCELAEACEGIRKPAPSDHIPEFTLEEEELADAIIRVMDYSSGFRLRVAEALVAKMAFNSTRPRMHGKAF